mmetsp:Transcript_4544/g.6011  ORF Transcript_4544/g.6011 Transcript_4544/m.6011 type:complete len:123 (-) Transcript_4544:1347-1715(-)
MHRAAKLGRFSLKNGKLLSGHAFKRRFVRQSDNLVYYHAGVKLALDRRLFQVLHAIRALAQRMHHVVHSLFETLKLHLESGILCIVSLLLDRQVFHLRLQTEQTFDLASEGLLLINFGSELV